MARYKKVISYWKRKYGYSSNDPRYLTASYRQVLEDILEDTIEGYASVYEAHDDETNRLLKQQEIDPDFDEKQQQELNEILQAFFTEPIPEEEDDRPQ